MITFLDENDAEYGALATIKATNAVNGERSLTGTIVSGDYVLSNIERGWRLRFDDEYYVVTYAKPIDEGRDVQVEFDAVHQFFWDFDKSSVYDQLSDGSHTFRAYLDFIFKNSGYSYTVDSALNVYAFEKQSFGFKKRLTLFNDIITSTGVEFQVNGKVVRILEKVGTDLSTVIRKNFNMNELTIEKNIGDFVTYQKGFGAYFDEEDHSKGRLEVEYTSPLASVYGKLEAEPFVDERYSQSSSLLAVLKENVDNSYTISVALDMEDLTRAGYKYKQPVAGDYIMAINETLDFQEKIRIVSFTSEYGVDGQLIKHTVTCNDIGSVKKLSAGYNLTKKQASSASATANNAYSVANKALISADGKNTNYYGDSFPVDNPKGTLKTGDLLFLTVGDKVKQYYWNGSDWVINPVLDDVEAFKEQIADELKDVPNREEFENKISEELANSKAEIETQIETAKTQAESNAKEYADTINQETARVAELANAAADEIKADLVNVKNNLTATSLVANNAQAAVDAAKQELTEVNTKVDSAKAELTQAKQDLTNVANDLSQAKTDLQEQASQLTEQANAQSELTKRVSSVEKTADGTKTTVSELSKTVSQNGKDITSVTARTKVVEDDLTSTKTTLSQVQTTADSTSQKTATLETGLNGVKADLTATTTTANTTKTNLANYQASNDKAVANLQSNMQTANGNISSLQTKVEAVPGQITSAVSAVEGKIPTSIGGRNLWIQSKAIGGFVEETLPDNHITGQKKCYRITNNNELAFNIEPDFSSRLYRKVTFSAWVKYDNVVQGPNNWNVFNCFKHELVRKNSSTGATTGTDFLTLGWFTGTSDWKRITYTYDYAANKSYDQLKTSLKFNLENVRSGTAWVTGVKIEIGSIPSDYSPAPEDTATQISNLSSEIKQTADGMTLLATKTELNSAKNELQSGINTATNKANNNAQTINTHTTQISALNTGLQAKVSQTDFNTLSGRVTSAENNITAKANELSSKITSVEGKIPTNIGTVNLIKGSGSAFVMGFGITNTTWDENKKQSILDFSAPGVRRDIEDEILPQGNKFSDFKPIKGTTYTQSMMIDTDATFNPNGQAKCSWFANGTHNQQKAYIKKVGAYSYQVWSPYTWNLENTALRAFDWYELHTVLDFRNSGTYLAFYKPKLTTGTLPSDWSPSPDDYDDAISQVKSEIKQTADGMTLLATKTELNSAKNELQSGINTATNKANNNAQTINTHTTQISALNTGLQAKVSQTDFNMLSGRVTTAENNITAKANELSSKITSVEGKIPTEMGSSNLLRKTAVIADNLKLFGTSNSTINVVTKDGHQTYKIVVSADNSSGVNFNGNDRYYNLIKNRTYTFSFWVLTNKDKSYGFDGLGHIQAINENGDIAGSDKLHQHTTPVYSTNTIKANTWTKVWCTFKVTSNSYFMPFFWYLASGDEIYIYDMMLNEGNIPLSYTPAYEDTVSQINAVSSEFKQTTDAIKASVSSLDSSTVKSSSLTINSDGIVMKAGKSTTDVANAIGSYFAVNQNAINLFSDKINVKGNMIVSGAITSDKIASKSINTAHLNGKIITADVIATNAITADAIRAGAVTTDKMSANSINGDRIAAGTLDAAKIKAGSITASQIASGTITSNQIKAGGISSANIAAGAITTDKIAAGAIDANKIAANAITANMIRGGQLNSTNGATVFDLNAGTLTFNNNSGYIQRVASDKVFEITTHLSTTSGSQEYLTSAFNIRKSDNSRQSGVKFTLYNTVENKPTAEAKINADALILYDSQNTRLFSVHGKSTFMGSFNTQDWGDIPIAKVHGGLVVNDIGIGSHTKSLLKIVEELCKKAGILWV